MADPYVPRIWLPGERLTAAGVNHLEQGVAAAVQSVVEGPVNSVNGNRGDVLIGFKDLVHTVWTGAANASSSQMLMGDLVLRTNEIPNPGPNVNTDGWFAGNTVGNFSLEDGKGKFVSTNNNGAGSYVIATGAILADEGVTKSARMTLTNLSQNERKFKLAFLARSNPDGTGSIGTSNAPDVVFQPGETKDIAVTYLLPATTKSYKLAVVSGGDFLIGDAIYFSEIIAETGPNTGIYFDGGSSAAITKSDVGLSNVDNTSDLAKPISTATANALTSVATGAANDTEALRTAVRNRKIDTGTGLTGGGDLSADRTISLSTATQDAINGKALATRKISTATALTGGGDLSADRTLDLSAATKASLGKADSSVQKVNGVSPDANGNVVTPAGLRNAETSFATEIPLYIYGDSFTTGAGATKAARGFASLLGSAARLNPSDFTNYGVSGTIMMEIARNILVGSMSNSTRRGIHVINSGINSIINTTAANDAQEKTGFVTALKAVLRILRGSWVVATHSSIAYSSGWVDKTLAANTHSTPVRQSDTSGSYATITTSAAEIAVMLIGFAAPSGSDGTDFTMQVNGAAFTPEVSTTSSQTSPLNPWSPQSIRVVNPNPGTNMTVRITRTTGNSFYIDGYVVKDVNSPMILVNKIIPPTQAGLEVNGASANRTLANLDVFNGLIDQVLALPEFQDGNVRALAAPTGWSNSTHRASDQLHPNNLGHKLLAQHIEAYARTLPASTGMNL